MHLEDPELALLALLTQRPTDPLAVRHKAVSTGPAIDWMRFAALVDRHRIAPLAFDALTDIRDIVPDAIYGRLHARARQDQLNALTSSGVLALVVGRLSDAGIETVCIKGPTLGMLAFGDAGLRQFKDIDIVISSDQGEDAIAVLMANGFRLIEPGSIDDPDRWRMWMRLMKDATLLHEATDTLVELHWRMNQNPYLIGPALASSRQTIAMGSYLFSTLSNHSLLLYLSVHGAEHLWFRLKWLADVAAILSAYDDGYIAAFYRKARRRRLTVPAGLMLLMVEDVYGLTTPRDVRRSILRSWRIRLLRRLSLRALHRITEPETGPANVIHQCACHLLFRSGARYVGWEMLAPLVDRPAALALSRSRMAIPLSIVSRPFLWLSRKFRQQDNR